ncbi:MAG: response regulator [Pseudomonadota bacterium]|nr:response regulator [Pseudomonadota bacterium]
MGEADAWLVTVQQEQFSYSSATGASVQFTIGGRKMKILLVEDDAVIGFIAQEWLIQFGHEVLGPAFTASEALTLVLECRPDLAFVDINLEGHDEGIELARGLRDTYQVPCVFVSGQPASARANPDAAFGYLPKPYSLDDLEQSAQFVSALVKGESPPPPDAPAALELF